MVSFIIAAIVGIGVGILSGLLGVGGGTVMVPVFRLLFGMSPVGSTATSLFTIIPTSLSGLTKHVKNKTCLPKVGLVAGLAGACMSPLGALGGNYMPGWTVMAAATAVIVYSSYTMFKKAKAAPKRPKAGEAPAPAAEAAPAVPAAAPVAAPVAAAPAAPAAEAAPAAAPVAAASAPAQEIKSSDDIVLTASFVIKTAIIGAVAGLVGGFVGVGGGFLMVPMFLTMLNIPMRLASGTSLMAVCILAIPGAVTQGLMGNIDFLVGLAMACGTIPGARLGATWVKKVPERTLRFIFAAFLLIMGILLLANELFLA